MSRSEFPPVPKSIRLFSITEGTRLPEPRQPARCTATLFSRCNLGRFVLVGGVLGIAVLLILYWLGVFEPLVRITPVVGNDPGKQTPI